MGIDQQFLYPPQVEAYMPAFLIDSPNSSCRIYFSKTQFNKKEDIKHVQLTASFVQSGKTALNNDPLLSDKKLWPSGIKLCRIYEDSSINTNYKYYVELKHEDLKNGFAEGQFYKIQLRFSNLDPFIIDGSSYNTLYDSIEEPKNPVNLENADPGATWFQDNLESFSEWSTVTLIKGIPAPIVKLQGFLMSDKLMASVYDSLNYTVEQFENGLFVNEPNNITIPVGREDVVYSESVKGYNTCDRVINPDTNLWTKYYFQRSASKPEQQPTVANNGMALEDEGWMLAKSGTEPDEHYPNELEVAFTPSSDFGYRNLFLTKDSDMIGNPGDPLWMTSLPMQGENSVRKVFENGVEIELDYTKVDRVYPLTARFWDSEYANTLFPNIFVGNSDIYGSLAFVGQYSCKDASEPLKYYEAYLYDANTLELISTIEKSYPDSNYSAETETNPFYEDGYYLENGVYSGFHCRFKTILEDGRKYKVTVKLITKNDYLIETSYTFTTAFSQIFLSNVKVTTQPDEENGRVKIILSPYDSKKSMETGNIFILRSDHRSNFGIWEMLYEIDDADLFKNNTIELYDHTVESGVLYKYYVSGNRDNSPTAVLYEDMFLVAENKQLKIQFNPKITSFKYVVSENKFETLGSKYPFIRRNANTRYREFGISGLISTETDENELFFEDRQVRPHTLSAGTANFDSLHLVAQIGDILKVGQGTIAKYFRRRSISSLATNADWDSIPSAIAERLLDNYYTETAFRQAVIDFLYNNTVKLFKSTTEGNILVKVTNVSLSPVEALGRRLYSFDATLVEIDDFTLDKCIEYNVQVI